LFHFSETNFKYGFSVSWKDANLYTVSQYNKT